MLQLQFIILPIVAGVLLIVGLGLVITWHQIRKDSGRYKIINQRDWNHEWMQFTGWLISVFGGLAFVALVICLVPFQPKYWVLTEHNGSIATISNRFVDGTGDITESTYTLTLDGEDTPLVVSDSRITGLKVGQQVSLTCSLGWVYGGADVTNCYLRSF